MTDTFGARLRRALDTRGPLCAGIDPHGALLTAWGLSDDVAGLESFAGTVVEALADRVAVLKPQSAFFERFGSRGVAVLERTVADARSAGALVIMDAKRGDIGSTVEAYAQAYLDPASPLFSDALTASPYLGFGALEPLYSTAEKHGAGVFVLAFTSNPEGARVQRARTEDGATVGAAILTAAGERNAGALPLGPIGAVVGATLADIPYDLAALNGALLAPGLGAQGATPEDLRKVFGDALRNVVPSMSREILRQGPRVEALREAAARSVDACRRALGY
ncbi:MAG TPA: orotidine-5'-phosphate decarboxylase [Actinocrinis sp.]|jgi:orotidine 5'-phosphate decarboxylase subfamily 2|uniref:orotidine-5'-phosphate decarboxylase n=1 Tax=Actinocrinis sp. TaxID=1920516 RepID=UPI002DDD12D5|nr:orotidine-5'-phosphate decarboxylase [Actinocrinis sp.]HEV3169006.1 orotidine-5'-phosphate decarboxylase [Actinocrinis sp.]